MNERARRKIALLTVRMAGEACHAAWLLFLLGPPDAAISFFDP